MYTHSDIIDKSINGNLLNSEMTVNKKDRDSLFNIGLHIWVFLLLVIFALAVYWQVNGHEFVNYDDSLYVIENPQVKNGVDLNAVIWAFKSTHAANWHPLTWLSHMADVELYGLAPGAHHLTSVVFHIANSLLLFVVLRRMTGHLWQSAVVAALFALHPLHVESVAWVAERKDVLSTFFWLLTMLGYARYAERPGVARYLLVVGCFMLGLMTKPMLVTLPFVLLLLDYWPLRRVGIERFGEHQSGNLPCWRPLLGLVWEKLPLFLLAIVSSVITFWAQKKGGAVGSMELYPLTSRVANALVSYVKYIGKTIWPVDLAAFYPHPGSLPAWQVVGAGVLLVLITVAALRSLRQRPWFVVGWLWFVGTLVPVIGLVQIGLQAMADRYTYIPLIGLFMIVAWGVSELIGGWQHKKKLLATAAIILLMVLSVVSWRQTTYWKNSVTLFQHALAVTENNYLAHNALGSALKGSGQTEAALIHYFKALEIRPDYAAPHYNIGHTLAQQGKQADAIRHFQKAIHIKPEYAAAHDHLGYMFVLQDKFAEAVSHYLAALQIKPDDAQVHNRLGLALKGQGQIQTAANHFHRAVKIDPFFAAAHYNLGHAQMTLGHLNEAKNQFGLAIRLRPDYVDAHYDLGNIFMREGRFAEAIKHYSAVVRLNPNHAAGHNNLGAAMIIAGQPQEAISHFRAALRIQPDYADAHNNLNNTLATQENNKSPLHYKD